MTGGGRERKKAQVGASPGLGRPGLHPGRLCALGFAAIAVCLGLAQGAQAADDDDEAPAAGKRPAIKTNRWQEDWSALADPALRTEPFDNLKYIPLDPADPKRYLSLGLTLRERFESNHDAAFGILGVGDAYLLDRLMLHADLHFDANWRLFTQIEDVRTVDKDIINPADENPLDLRLAFLEYVNATSEGTFKARVGRQDFAFDLQRFVSSREGPNVRQSFDAVWADWEQGPWRVLGFVSQPVQYRNEDPFDDFSDSSFRFSTARVERQVFDADELSAYYALYERDRASYLDASGSETRHALDARFAGTEGNLDWDIEAMGQFGTVGTKDIAAWAAGGRVGYTFADAAWTPRLGLQADIASGDRKAGDGDLETFNPLFPNGYYFTLGGYTGFSNLIHVKPSITVNPSSALSVMAALGFLWRETTADAIYVQPSNPLPGTAGAGDLWTGAYGQLRLDYKFSANLTGAIEAVHYEIGDTIAEAGGKDSSYLGVELKFGW